MSRYFLLTLVAAVQLGAQSPPAVDAQTVELPFTSHDGYPMLGKLTLPASSGAHAVVIYVQTAEGMTVDMKRPQGRGETFSYFNLYREKLPAIDVAFFCYEGRGIRNGDKPPRYETVDRDVYDTSTLDNKVRDALAAVKVVKKHKGIDASRIFLMGASEGTLLAAQAAARAPAEIHGLVLYGVLTRPMNETFKYIVSDGGYLSYLRFFDTDKDGKISKAEFEADPNKYREVVFKNGGFENFDRDGDGYFTADDMKIMSKYYLDAVDAKDYEILDKWAQTAAGVSTPKGWFKDHFAQPPMWTFLSSLDLPIGLFQGRLDAAVPIAGVRAMEEQAKKAGKSKMEFFYFDNLDHTLGIGSYFVKGKLPAGHKAIFEFIERNAGMAADERR
jgi:pimeloyl-ACP methyl ester carboxylesterase